MEALLISEANFRGASFWKKNKTKKIAHQKEENTQLKARIRE